MKILQAKKEDIQGIMNIQNECLIANKEQMENEGFLVYPIKAGELERLIYQENIILVAKDDKDDVVGYLLTYDLKDWMKYKPNWISDINVSNNIKEILLDNKILYLRHIAKKRGIKGVGKYLMNNIFEIAKDYNYMIAEILEDKPKNNVSIRFSLNIGFKRIGDIKYEDGLKWGLYLIKVN